MTCHRTMAYLKKIIYKKNFNIKKKSRRYFLCRLDEKTSIEKKGFQFSINDMKCENAFSQYEALSSDEARA